MAFRRSKIPTEDRRHYRLRETFKLISYTDDNVLFAMDIVLIEVALSKNIESLANWFDENELSLNLKKGKLRLLFGTSKRLSTVNRIVEVKYKQDKINVTTSFKYLGVEVVCSLNLNNYFERCYKKGSSRLYLLFNLRPQMDANAATTICKQ